MDSILQCLHYRVIHNIDRVHSRLTPSAPRRTPVDSKDSKQVQNNLHTHKQTHTHTHTLSLSHTRGRLQHRYLWHGKGTEHIDRGRDAKGEEDTNKYISQYTHTHRKQSTSEFTSPADLI